MSRELTYNEALNELTDLEYYLETGRDPYEEDHSHGHDDWEFEAEETHTAKPSV